MKQTEINNNCKWITEEQLAFMIKKCKEYLKEKFVTKNDIKLNIDNVTKCFPNVISKPSKMYTWSDAKIFRDDQIKQIIEGIVEEAKTMFITKDDYDIMINKHVDDCQNTVNDAVNIYMNHIKDLTNEGGVSRKINNSSYNDEMDDKLRKYEKLVFKNDLTDEERSLRAELRIELKQMSKIDITKLKDIQNEFMYIEKVRKSINDSKIND